MLIVSTADVESHPVVGKVDHVHILFLSNNVFIETKDIYSLYLFVFFHSLDKAQLFTTIFVIIWCRLLKSFKVIVKVDVNHLYV